MRQITKNGLKFVEVERSDYGPQKSNPVYWCCDYRVQRHHWTLPRHHWGWRASYQGKTLFGETLEEIADSIIVKEKIREVP